jgi:maltooligosyltrehalose trehalohydrolase
VVRLPGGAHGDRLLVVNLGGDLELAPAPEPLLAPPAHARWELAFSTDDPRYGGPGTVPAWRGGTWRLPAASAQLFFSRAEHPGGETS